MAAHPTLSSMVLAAPAAAPDLQAAIATAYDWHQGAGGLYAFASNGGQVADEAVRQAALQEVEQSLAWVRSQQGEIDSGQLSEFKADQAAAQQLGLSPTDYLLQRLDNLKAALGQGQPEVPTAPPAPQPAAPVPATASARQAKTVISVAVFNQARQIAQLMLQKLKGSDSELEGKVSDVLYELNEIETQAGGNLTEALDDETNPTVARWASKMIHTLAALRQQVGTAPTAPQEGREHSEPDTRELEPGMTTASVQVRAFLHQADLLTPASRIKTATNGSVHLTALKPGAATLGALLKFAAQSKISVRLVKAFEDEDEAVSCPECNGPGVPLGALGSRKHYRCRDCGAGFSHDEAQAPKFAASDEDPDESDDRRWEKVPARPTWNEEKQRWDSAESKQAAQQDLAQPARPAAEELPFDEGSLAAFANPTVADALGVTAAESGPEPEDHVLKAGDQYLVLGDDPSNARTVKISLVSSQKQATHLGHSLAALWLDDDRLSRFIAAELPEGVPVRVVRVVPKKTAAAKVAVPLPPPTANGNHAGPANPVNPTGAPTGAPVPDSPTPMSVQPYNQGPAVVHTNPGTPAPPPQSGAPQLGPNGQPLQAAWHPEEGVHRCSCGGDWEPSGSSEGRMIHDEWCHEDKCDKCGKTEFHAWNLPTKRNPMKKKEASCGGKDCKGDCPNCKKKKEAAARTADDAQLSAMAREVVMAWMSGHPMQQPSWQSPDWKQLWEQNRADCPDENGFITACQKAYTELSQAVTKQGSRVIAALALKARGLKGPSAEKGDTVANAVKFMTSNADQVGEETIGSLRQLLADAGYSRTVAECAIEDKFGADATLAGGAKVKDLIKGKD